MYKPVWFSTVTVEQGATGVVFAFIDGGGVTVSVLTCSAEVAQVLCIDIEAALKNDATNQEPS